MQTGPTNGKVMFVTGEPPKSGHLMSKVKLNVNLLQSRSNFRENKPGSNSGMK